MVSEAGAGWIVKVVPDALRTEKLLVTGGATAYALFPACVASTEQVPTATMLRVAPDTVQTGVVREMKETGNPELAVAVRVTGGAPMVRFGSGLKVIVCAAPPEIVSTPGT